MDFGANKTLVEVIKDGAFGGTFFRDTYSDTNDKCIKTQEKNLVIHKILIKNFIAQIMMMLMLINMVLNVEHHLDFGKIMDGLILQILMVAFNGILDIGQVEGLQMIKDKLQDVKEL